jgi:hypothetical protein
MRECGSILLVVGRSFFVSFWVNEDETKVLGAGVFIIKKGSGGVPVV